MTWPTCGSLTPRLRAMSLISPITTNSLVPMAKPPMARANRIKVTWRGLSTGAAGDTGDMPALCCIAADGATGEAERARL